MLPGAVCSLCLSSSPSIYPPCPGAITMASRAREEPLTEKRSGKRERGAKGQLGGAAC